MKKVSKWHILSIGLFFFILAGVLIWLGLSFIDTAIDKALIVLASVLSIIVSSIFFIIFFTSFGKTHNVFLYDKKTKKLIEVNNLTYEKICEFIDLYMGVLLHNKKFLSFSDFGNDDFLASVPKEYHPLILIRFLLIWMELETNKQWKQLAKTDKKHIDTIENILFTSGEYLISSKLQYLRASYIGDDTDIKEFFLNNIDYLRQFLLNYVKDNIHAYN